ncbi:MAG: hypothetical protein GMKNLPBB_00070 [Myxococcota bacterium]|nr:hypothetical protein [Myxococcota bacterium]
MEQSAAPSLVYSGTPSAPVQPVRLAIFRVEGVLLRRGVLSASAYFAANSAGFRERLLRLGGVALTAPMAVLTAQNDRTMSNRAAWASLRGMSEDRLRVLGEEYAGGVLPNAVLPGGLDWLRKARADGFTVIAISENISHAVGPWLSSLRDVDEWRCNHLEIRHGEATGRLKDPVVGGHESGEWIRILAREKNADLSRSRVYASAGPDLLLMSRVGFPCAVNPDFTLRRAATESGWPIMDYNS